MNQAPKRKRPFPYRGRLRPTAAVLRINTRKRKAKKAVNPPAMNSSGSISRVPKAEKPINFIRALSDPFLGSACVPDGTKNVGCFTYRGVQQMVTGTGTASTLCVSFDPAGSLAIDNGSASNQISYGAAGLWQATPLTPTYKTLYARWRPISMALKITPTMATNVDQGVLTVAQLNSNDNPRSTDGMTSATMASVSSYYEMSNLKKGCLITWRPEDQEDYSFVPINANPGNFTQNNSGVPFLIVSLQGAQPNSVAAMVDVVIHWEGYYQNQGALFGTVGPTSVAIPGWYEKTMNALRLLPAVAWEGVSVYHAVQGMRNLKIN